MGLVTFVSAKGAPGVTTCVVGLAFAWPEAVPGRSCLAVDADPAGGATAPGILRGALPPAAGILPLATSRGLTPLEAVDAACVHLLDDGSARLIPGVPDPARSAALPLAWDVFCPALDELDHAGVDILVDGGRADLTTPSPWIESADVVVLVARPTLPGVTAAHRAASSWAGSDGGPARPPLHLVVVDAPSPYRPREVAEALELPLLGVVAFDPEAARVHSDGAAPGRGFDRSGYRKSLEGLAGALAGLLGPLPAGQPAADPVDLPSQEAPA